MMRTKSSEPHALQSTACATPFQNRRELIVEVVCCDCGTRWSPRRDFVLARAWDVGYYWRRGLVLVRAWDVKMLLGAER